ncbi:hypothetical protein BDV06DRAFT_62390 [Aspergillus oleicola]
MIRPTSLVLWVLSPATYGVLCALSSIRCTPCSVLENRTMTSSVPLVTSSTTVVRTLCLGCAAKVMAFTAACGRVGQGLARNTGGCGTVWYDTMAPGTALTKWSKVKMQAVPSETSDYCKISTQQNTSS